MARPGGRSSGPRSDSSVPSAPNTGHLASVRLVLSPESPIAGLLHVCGASSSVSHPVTPEGWQERRAPIYNLNLTNIPQCYQLCSPVLGTRDGGQSGSRVLENLWSPRVKAEGQRRVGCSGPAHLALGKGEVPSVQQWQTGLSDSGMKTGLDINLPLAM